jgi:hypothetical protein
MTSTPQQRSTSPLLYRVAAVLFVLIGAGLIFAYFRTHDIMFAIFGGITLMNALMATLKSMVVRETRS